jgi:integrase/recombinase XerD
MRKKSGLTIIEQAIVLVPEFENVVRKPDQQLTLHGQSKSTLFLFPENFKKPPIST